MESTKAKGGRTHSEETKKKIAAGNTGKVFSEERRKNIGQARTIKLSTEKMTLLQEWWSKGYYPRSWIMKELGLSERVYLRIFKEECKVKQTQFLPQNLEPWVFEQIITLTKAGEPYKDIAMTLGLGEKQVRNIILKLETLHGISPIPKPRPSPVGEHKEKLRELLVAYNKQNPKKKEQNPNWKGGRTTLIELIRKSEQYKQWKMNVLQRDRFMCINCQAKKNLHVDHIYPLVLILDDAQISTTEKAAGHSTLWNLANGRTLCETCHKKTETYGKQRGKYEDRTK